MIPIFGLGNKARSLNVAVQERLNCFIDVQTNADKSNMVVYGTPGLLLVKDFGSYPMRGIWWVQSLNRLFVVFNSNLYELDAAGTATLRGNIGTTSGYVGMADNGSQLMIVDGSATGYILTLATNAFANAGAGYPGGHTVTFLDSYFIVDRTGTGQFFISQPYNGLTWNALNYATAESSPDSLVRVYADNGLLLLLGEVSLEYWQNSGALDFAFTKITGSPSEVGLGARWSVARCNGKVTMLGKTRRGGYMIVAMDNYSAVPISTPDIEAEINGYSVVSDAVAFSYTMLGHDFYQISFPTAGQTWLYDSNSRAWSRLQSDGQTRHLADLGLAFGTAIYTTDFSNGRIYNLSASTYTDNGSPIPRQIISPHVFDQTNMDETVITTLRVDLEGGVGLTSGQGSDPQMMLSISRDGGHTWGAAMWTPIGKIGEKSWRAEWRRLGKARNWVFKLRMTDPVKFCIISGYMDAYSISR